MDATQLTLRSLAGGRSSLDEWRGRRLLLVFVQPGCPHSAEILPVIAALHHDPPGDAPAPIIITSGGEEQNRRLFQGLGVRCPVLVQDDAELSDVYLAHETPAVCVVGADGRLAHATSTGAVNVLMRAGVMPGPGWSWETTPSRTAGDRYEKLWRRHARALDAPDLDQSNGGDDPAPDAELPLVSVIMTTRDRPGLLPIALECYRRQTYPRRELIVVDDGAAFPADEAAVTASGGRVIRVPEGTPIGTKLNRGATEARGSLCQKWDDDDWYAPQFLEEMVAGYRRHNAVICRPTVAYQRRSLWLDLERWRVLKWPIEEVAGGTLLFAREAWEECPFRPIHRSEDVWFVGDQMTADVSPAVVESPGSYVYVRHNGSATDRENVWRLWFDGQPVDTYLRAQSKQERYPRAILPDWAVAAYREVRREPARRPARPRLLFQTPVAPGFSGSGIVMRAGMLLRSLAERYDVYLMVIHVPGLPANAVHGGAASLCREWTVIGRGNSAPEMRHVATSFRDVSFDVVHSFQLDTTTYAEPFLASDRPGALRPRWHLDLADIESEQHQRSAERYRANGEREEAAGEEREARRYAALEARVLPRCDRVYVCSQREKKRLEALYDLQNVVVMPNAVSTPLELPPRDPSESIAFLFVGTLDYYANEDAVRFLGREIVPLLRRRARRPFRIDIVGSGEPSPALRGACRQPEIDLVGKVRRLEPWYHRADIVLAPLRTGGGTRIKILEAMSFRRPVVSTSIGIEGLEVIDGEHVLIGDTPVDFAKQCVRLMSDRQLTNRIAESAFNLCAREYSLEAMRAALDDAWAPAQVRP
jgi:glycosyltransferase involved in cell wall biosynthesis